MIWHSILISEILNQKMNNRHTRLALLTLNGLVKCFMNLDYDKILQTDSLIRPYDTESYTCLKINSPNYQNTSILTLKRIGRMALELRTPIWFMVNQGLIYFRTDAKSGKVKRIRNNPHVRIAPCNIGGNVEGIGMMEKQILQIRQNRQWRIP